MRIGIIGGGKMGRAVEDVALTRGHEIVVMLGSDSNDRGAAVRKGALAEADVAIEFTEPGAAVENAHACVEQGIPIVIGTTGWQDEMDRLRDFVRARDGAVLWAPNFSVGVVLFNLLVRRAGEVFADKGFAAHLVETHHSQKRDAPSGTALGLARTFEEASGTQLPTTSIRSGSVPGTHTVHFDAPFEHVQLEHEARDRRVFADGAIRAAQWLIGRIGVFTMEDVLQVD